MRQATNKKSHYATVTPETRLEPSHVSKTLIVFRER
jgi:hypothetical protein